MLWKVKIPTLSVQHPKGTHMLPSLQARCNHPQLEDIRRYFGSVKWYYIGKHLKKEDFFYDLVDKAYLNIKFLLFILSVLKFLCIKIQNPKSLSSQAFWIRGPVLYTSNLKHYRSMKKNNNSKHVEQHVFITAMD
jgi:hypothetical protein